MSKALVLGATGHIGAHVVRALLDKGYQVRAAFRQPRYRWVLEGLSVEEMRVDLDEPASLEPALDGCQIVFHCAGFYPAWTARRQPAIQRGVTQVRRLFERLADGRVERIIYTSSAATIAPSAGRPMAEQDRERWPLAQWRGLYATVKVAMEHEVLRFAARGAPVTVVNPSVCIGEYDARPFSGRLVLLYAKRRLPFYLEHVFNVVYSGDVGAGHVLAAERGRVGESYLLACRDVTMREFGRMVAERTGVAPPRWPVPRAAALAVASLSELAAMPGRREPLVPIRAVLRRSEQRLDGAKAVRELGMPQTPPEEAIARCLAWFRRHGHLA
ncbi:MAG: NAD-dependent epimerase/dehydratase family protein [Candidatus Omnitrophica bacterium]|nr:NAD-dependent epimerase/dehydratase family protein [Candidatus Omnitrophota bacterium]